MRISENGLNLIKRFESFSPAVYLCPAKKLTIGYGHVLRKGEPLDWVITKEEGEYILDRDCDIAESAVNSIGVKLNQNQFDALVSFTFNVGVNAFKKSTLVRLLKKGDYNAAGQQFDRWIFGNGRILNGLVRRRDDEKRLFFTPTEEL